jgi:hypothetical protein
MVSCALIASIAIDSVTNTALGERVNTYQAMKQTMLATSSKLPKPPNTHEITLRNVRLGGGEIWFAPNRATRRCA